MRNPFADRLNRYVTLPPEDGIRLDAIVAKRSYFPPACDIIREGYQAHHVLIILSGWAVRYKVQRGRQAIVAYLFDGDLSSPFGLPVERSDWSLRTMTPVEAAWIPAESFASLLASSPSITEGVRWYALAEELITRRWLIDMAQKDTLARTAHFLCEAWERAAMVGLAKDEAMHLPFTQHHLADLLGMTSVHVNRVLKQLRELGIASFVRGRLEITDRLRLEQVARFHAGYLHPRG